MATLLCKRCMRPMAEATAICRGCLDVVLAELRSVPGVVEDLVVSHSRQDRITEHEGRRSADVPLPYREHASEAGWVLHGVLLAWVRTLSGKSRVDWRTPIFARGVEVDWDESDTVELSRWLLRHPDALRRHEHADAAIDEVVNAIRNARGAVDRPAVLVYRGPCDECGKDLYVPEWLAEIRCRTCGATYDGAQRRAELVRRMEHQLATAVDIARALSSLLGESVPAGRIYQWRSRNRLLPKGVDRRGRPLFAVGDVMSLMTHDRAS